MSNSTSHPAADEEWEKLLQQLQQQSRLRSRPFLYTRIQARLSATPRAAPLRLPGWVRRSAYVALLGTLGLAVSRDSATQHPAPLTSRYQPGPVVVPPPH